MGETDDPLKGATRDQGSSVTTVDGRESHWPRFYLLASSPCLQPGYVQVGPLLPEDGSVNTPGARRGLGWRAVGPRVSVDPRRTPSELVLAFLDRETIKVR